MSRSLSHYINSKLRIWLLVLMTTLASEIFSLTFTWLSMLIYGPTDLLISFAIAGTVPLLVAPPATYLVAHYAYQLYHAHQALFHLAHTDELTALANRRAFFTEGIQRLNKAQETKQPVGLILLDTNHFKQINDRLGHAVGDDALRFLAQILNANTAPTDLVARLGGDEFAILRAPATMTELTACATQIRQQLLQQPYLHQGSELWLSFSMGIADTTQASTLEGLLQASDVALYQQKAAYSIQPKTGEAKKAAPSKKRRNSEQHARPTKAQWLTLPS